LLSSLPPALMLDTTAVLELADLLLSLCSYPASMPAAALASAALRCLLSLSSVLPP